MKDEISGVTPRVRKIIVNYLRPIIFNDVVHPFTIILFLCHPHSNNSFFSARMRNRNWKAERKTLLKFSPVGLCNSRQEHAIY